jgi:hypothetical protein
MTKQARRAFACTAIAIVAALLAACDVLNGVRRSTVLDSLPDLTCAEAAIRSTPAVESVIRKNSQLGQTLTLSGMKPAGDAYYFMFKGREGSNVIGVVGFTTNSRGNVEFSNYDFRINAVPPQSEIDATRAVMIQIESALRDQCGFERLAAGVKEYCHGVECKPLVVRSP